MELKLLPVTNDEQRELAFDIRRVVYIQEQDVPEELEFDGLDDTADNYLVTTIEGQPIATFRIIYKPGFSKLERFAVLEEWREKGVGKFCVENAIDIARKKGYVEAQLDAQVRSIGFYEKFGFKVISGEFLDAGIPHKKMSKNITIS